MPAPGAAGRAAPCVAVRRVDSVSADSPDRGSCRVRLPASCGLPYHKPVIVTLRSLGGSEQPWRLLCITAIAHDDFLDVASCSGGSSTRSSCSSSGASVQNVVDRAVADATVVLPPPGRQPWEVHAALSAAASASTFTGAAPACVSQQHEDTTSVSLVAAQASPVAAAVVVPCPGTNTVPVAAEVQLRLVSQQHPAPARAASSPAAAVGGAAASDLWDTQAALSERLSFKLHQTLVLPGCYVRLSESVAVQVVGLSPAPPGPDCPARIVPSTRLVFTTADGSSTAASDALGHPMSPAAAAVAAEGAFADDAPAAVAGAPAKKKAASSKSAAKSAAGKEEGGSGAGGSGKASGRSKKADGGAVVKAPAGGEEAGGAGSNAASGTAAPEAEAGAVDAAAADMGEAEAAGKASAATKPKKKKKEGSGSKSSKTSAGIRATASAFDALMGLEDD